MPQRFLRPGITTSKPWNSLNWITQSFYIRLITLVDDHGRFEADPLLLKSLAFPLSEDVKRQQVSDMCEHLQSSGLAIFYEVMGKKFLQLTKWKERIRSESKYPPFEPKNELLLTNDSNCQTFDGKCLPPKPEPLAISHKPEPEPLVAEVVSTWNCIEVLPKCLSVTEKRVKAIKSRMSDEFFSKHWKSALGKITASDFCMGKNDRGWKADIDFFLKPDSVAKLIEGKFENKTLVQPKTESIADSWINYKKQHETKNAH